MPLKKINNVVNINVTMQNFIDLFLVSKLCAVKIQNRQIKNEDIVNGDIISTPPNIDYFCIVKNFNLNCFFTIFTLDKIIIVPIMHTVPNHSGSPKETCNQNTDKKAADKGSTEDSTLVSVGCIYFKLDLDSFKFPLTLYSLCYNYVASYIFI